MERDRKRPSLPSPRSRIFLFSGGIGLIIFFLCLGVWQVALFSEARMLDRIGHTGNGRLELYSSSLLDTLEKYRPLPYLLARDSRVRGLLAGRLPPVRVNPHLEDFSRSAGALIFVMDHTGRTVASSNWRTPRSLIGANFSFRPYFQDARHSIPGGYYAVGLKTGKPGFFLSYPIFQTGNLLGVVAVKVDLERLQQSWRDSEETVLVSDSHGVLFLSSNRNWRYRSMRVLPDSTARQLRHSQYPGKDLSSLAIRREVTHSGNILELDNKRFLEQSRQLTSYGWRIHYLSDLSPAHFTFRLTLAMGAGLCLTLFLVLLYLRERKQKQISRYEAREAAAIRTVNDRLAKEVVEHKETEKTLRQTQNELIQAGKLAGLGRMSAAITHELNQPVTAIRTFLASTRIFLERGKINEVSGNLDLIDDLTDRMAAITHQLKTFARQQKVTREPTDLSQTVHTVLNFWKIRFEDRGFKVNCNTPEPGKATVMGNPLQLEQVIQNLVRNSMDGCEHRSPPEITIEVKIAEDRVHLMCHDNGCGFDEESLESLFEPFYTTKEIGKGLGLGLAICYGIIREMDGTISASNHTDGGGCIDLYLPCHPITSGPEAQDR